MVFLKKYFEIIESELYVRELKLFYYSIISNFPKYKEKIK